ncbi:hypothetical protein J4468_03535 [Candidatus Woesearchaeota archaeon]|nr:hypothetical protein [Candidatus Woesearchaeota archaeon]
MEDLKERIYQEVVRQGPVLPVKISKLLGGNLMFFSAYLSELVANQRIFLTHTKIGSSPLYYIKGQEHKLPEKLYEHLGGSMKEVFDLLKLNKVIRDADLPPRFHHAITELKDFAVPLDVTFNDNTERFWKWRFADEEAVKSLISKLLEKHSLKKPEVKQELPKLESNETMQLKKESELKKSETQKSLVEKISEKKSEKKISSEFMEQSLTFFQQKGIQVLDEDVIRKQSDIEFVISVPSAIGHVKFFVKAKNKKKITPGDLSLAYSKAQSKKLPLLYISTGEISKKTEDYIGKNFDGLKFKKI